MKRTLIIILAMIIFATTISYGEIKGYDGGVMDDYLYKEVVFITGEPIVVEGSVKIQEREKNNVVTTTYTFNLENDDADMQLKRRFSYETNLYDKDEKQQTVAVTTIEKFSERITIGADRYNLEDYQFSSSTIYDNRPAVDFYSANLSAKKTFSINRDEGIVVIESAGDTMVGYEHYWGASETFVIKQDISFLHEDGYVANNGNTYDISWEGLVTLKLSSTLQKDLSYVKNDPTNISFRGGILQNEKEENILQYDYDMPRFDVYGIPYDPEGDDDWRDRDDLPRKLRIRDEEEIRMDTVPIHKRLIIPNLTDISGHWAEESIFTLYSLEVFDDPSPYFGPKLPMTRAEFAKAVVRAISILGDEEEAEAERRQRLKDGEDEEEVFDDVDKEDDEFKYVKFVKEKGIMKGVSDSFFAPDGVLTRAQAITILIRTLGLETMAPNPPYRTYFQDDNEIPFWAKDAVYAASEIGLVTGDSYGRLNPNETMSKAEAATFIHRYIKHIMDDITVDYRERIINGY